jgi:CRISPR-associated endonuclease/helicase Cas3
MMSFPDFFEAATDHVPYAYQCRLACGEAARLDDDSSLTSGSDCRSHLIEVPTGLGKTAAVVIAWLWNRVILRSLNFQPSTINSPWPRRLVYCLPMRTLVEQTEKNVRKWLERLNLTDSVGVHILMGGEDGGKWDIYPEHDAILIGTQDMLLSRALNRGYGMSRYRWPMHFGLLNNDALWVMDETQLMGVGVETSAQLDAFRERLGAWGAVPTWWMSATLDEARIQTIDQRALGREIAETSLSADESARLAGRLNATKRLTQASVSLDPATKRNYARELVRFVVEKAAPDALMLVILNRVGRAQETYRQLLKLKVPAEQIALIHSRFRRDDRKKHDQLLFGKGKRIVVATQAVEAGVDVSARVLITELAPWPSLVQRFGRCNRYGECADGADVFWIDVQPKDARDELALPYDFDEFAEARRLVAPLADASPATLRAITHQPPRVIRPVIRRRDLLDLFDTTPDIAGQDLDVSRYIRDGDDNDIQAFWRDVAEPEPAETHGPHPDEICRVPLLGFAGFLKKDSTRAWRWNLLEERWERVQRARPGEVVLLSAASGGYSEMLGWTGEPEDKPQPLSVRGRRLDGYSDDPRTFQRHWETLRDHTRAVVEQIDALGTALGFEDQCCEALHAAAVWHDSGKAHEIFQEMLTRGAPPGKTKELQAKSDANCGRPLRKAFRHELASALAWLQRGPKQHAHFDLIAFIIAAHHGKVRLSIRSLPNEDPPPEPGRLFARGIWDGDPLPGGEFKTAQLNGQKLDRFELDLGYMQLGQDDNRGPSWLARMIALRDAPKLGPFRLALLETALRAADARASAGAEEMARP